MSKISDEKLIKASIEGDTEAKKTLKDRIQSVVLPAIKKRGINVLMKMKKSWRIR